MAEQAKVVSHDASAVLDAQHRSFFESIADPAYVLDQSTGRLLDVNDAAASAYGYTRDELIGRNVSEISAEPEATLLAVTNPAAVNLRLHRRRDGTTFHVEASARVVEWGGRKVVLGIARDISPRTRMEQALRDSEALLSTAFDHSPLLMSVTDLATDRYLEVNETFCRLAGFPEEEMVGRTAVELGMVTAAERDLLAQRLMDSQGRLAIELVIRIRSGAPILCRYWGTIVPTSAGPRLFAAAEDITAHREAQQAREEAFSRLEKIASRVPGVVYQYRLRPDGSSCFPFSSAGMQEIYGISPEEVREDASVVFSRLHPEDLDAVAASIQTSAKSLTPWRADYRVELDGAVRWVRGDAVPERESDGSVLWHGYITDITERKRAEQALKTSEERFKLAMEATSDGLWDWDLTTDSAYFSPGYFRMLGFEPDATEGHATGWRELIHPDDRGLVEKAAQDCIEGRVERFELEYRLRSKGGEWRWILSRGTCVARDANGRALRLLGTHVDVGERRRLQAGLAQSDRLASMGLLAAGVAHEINNPLAYVVANLDTLGEELPKLLGLTGRLSSALRAQVGEAAFAEVVGGGAELVSPVWQQELRSCADGALEGARRIGKISRSLGTFARVERLELETVDLNLAMEQAATMAHNEVKYRATLLKDFGQVPPVLATVGKLAQVFLNLIINAGHAIGEGDVARNRITLRSWATADSVFAEVSDTGCGIPPEDLERVFEPFFTTKKLGLGSGLGLSITRNILTEFGGDIRVESQVGGGTRMIVRLPVSARRPAESVEPTVPTATARVVPGRVLVVDDEAAIRKILTRALSPPHAVVLAASGREAKTILEQDPAFDVILSDLMMPEMTGMELHAWLVTQNPALARRCVFISGGAFTPSATDYLASVPNLRIDKPFDRTALRAVVEALVGASKAGT